MKGQGRLGRCFGLRLVDGQPYVDVVELPSGKTQSFPVPTLGGTPDRMIYAGPETALGDDEQGLDDGRASEIPTFRGEQRLEAHGAPPRAHRDAGFKDAQPEAPAQDDDHDGTIALRDVLMRNAGSMLLIDEHGNMSAFVADGCDFRLHLPDGGIARISRKGAAAERVPLAGPLLDYLAKEQARVDALVTTVTAIAQALVSGIEVASSGTTIGKTVSSGGVHTDTTKGDSSNMKAAALRISDDAE